VKRLTFALLIPALLVAALFAGGTATATPAQTSDLWLPFAANDWQARIYFTLPELEQAQRDNGYPPEEWAQHTVCELAPNMPRDQLWFEFCEQPYRIDANGDEDWSFYYLYRFHPVSDKVQAQLFERNVQP
jgi:hypothetical protein